MGEQQGCVVAFDPDRGLGTVETGDGRRLGFHCTGIADGSRRVDVGAPVRFRVVPGLLGAWEADALRPSA